MKDLTHMILNHLRQKIQNLFRVLRISFLGFFIFVQLHQLPCL